MNNKILFSAAVAGLLSLCSSLVLLFTGDGVKAFADISQVQYAVAVITSIATALGIIKAALSDSPEQTAKKIDFQSGFARTSLLWLLLAVSAILITAGCAINTPGKSIAAASIVIEQLAVQIDAAEKSGQISNEREDALMDRLKAINNDLRTVAYLAGDQQSQSLEAINERLAQLRAELALAQEHSK
jgi:hypothetical protein